MVKAYGYDTGYYEYVDEDGNKRIGKWQQKYQGDRDYYDHDGPIMNRKKVGTVDFYPDEETDDYVEGEPDPRKECPHCIQYNFHVKLQGRILQKGEQKPSDYDRFLQCHSCGNIVPAHEGLLESKIQDTRETIETPFESKFEVSGIAKRTTKEGKLTSARKRREKERPHHKDKEIDELLRIYGENVKIIYDSDP